MAPNPRLHHHKTILSFLFIIQIFFISTATCSSPAPSSSSSPPPPPPTVFDLLPIFGLPSGLFPDSVVNYTLLDDGQFAVVLENPCYIEFDYLVYYDKVITGKLSYGSITELKGIQVRRFFIWFDVSEIRVDLPPSDSIYFQVGWFINKKLDVHQFMTVRSCYLAQSGCGLRTFKPILQVFFFFFLP